MTIQMTTMDTHPRRLWRSIGAVLAGLIVVIALSTVTDIVMHATGVFPPWFQPMAEALWLLAIGYRVVYTIVGGYITARLAPDRPMRHALALGVVGTVIGIAGVAATWGRGPEFGPVWYSLALVLTGLPCCWLGGLLYRSARSE